MRYFRLLAYCVSIGLGLLIVVVSLFSASQVFSRENKSATQLKLYLNDPILPDNILYPAFMAADRLQLETASRPQQVLLQVEYAQRRMHYTEELLAQGNTELALTTLTKSQKYLNKAAEAALAEDISPEIKRYVVRSIKYHDRSLEQLMNAFDSEDKSILQKLCDESVVLKEKLKESLSGTDENN